MHQKKRRAKFPISSIIEDFECGRSSVVEHHVANVRVVSSNLIAR